MTPQELKNSILQLAVQGKLVEQRAEEGTAEELYKKIQAEKQKLIAEKKIKKEKPLPEITAEEIPFEIPESWKWVRLGDITSILGDGIHGTPCFDDNGQYYFINGNNLVKGKIVIKSDTKKVSFEEFIKYKKHLDYNTILISINGTIGNYAFYNGEPIVLGKSACYFSILGNNDKNYICYLLNTKHFFDYAVKKATQTTIKNISLKAMRMLPVALPPLAEQKRIVTKIEELLPQIDCYEQVYSKLKEFNKRFPEDMQKSILQYAVQGKLVEQRAEEGTAEELYKKIQAEKQKLTAEKKIKKEKPLPEITAEEIPFDIPESWKWVRLKDIVYNRGQMKPVEPFSYIDIGSIDNKRQLLNSEENIIQPDKAPSRARKIVAYGDILYSTVRPYLHNMCIINKTFSYMPIASTGFAVLTCCKGILNKFLFYYLLSPNFDSYANSNDNSKGVAYPAINDDKLYKGLVPLPPLEEQKRIVAKIKELLPLCEKLKK